MSERGFCADSQKCQLLCVHVPAGHDQFYRDYTCQGTLYDNLFLELFVDLYVVCAVVAIFPKKVRWGLRAVLYLILYSTAAADTYCYVNFGSTLNPSMLMLVGETNSSEASSFLSALISAEVLFSSVGWILLLALIQILIAIFRKQLIKLYVFIVHRTGVGICQETADGYPPHDCSHACQLRNPMPHHLHHRMLHLLAQQDGLP